MKQRLFYLIPIALCALLAGCSGAQSAIAETPTTVQTAQPTAQADPAPTADPTAEGGEVMRLVESFGAQLKNVSLLAPDAGKTILEQYAPYVAPELLAKWDSDPQSAPGRRTSSPWPERIEIVTLEKSADGDCTVRGNIIETDSTGKTAVETPVVLRVARVDGQWRIVELQMGDESSNSGSQTSRGAIYRNEEYGFSFVMPESWIGYTIVTEKWEGIAVDGKNAGKVTESGPKLSIRHPLWTQETPRQDIPIMIFTPAQWEQVTAEKLSVSAAPIPPTELGRNDNYIFALPARYNFAYLPGYEEVERIINGNSMQLEIPGEEGCPPEMGC